MKENEWTNNMKELLQKANLSENIYFDTLNKIPYAKEILSYDLHFEANKENISAFETDLLIYEKTDVVKPRVIIESKLNRLKHMMQLPIVIKHKCIKM